MMLYDKCANCGGTTSISSGKAICDYCGSEFMVSANYGGQENGEFLAEQLFDFSNIGHFENEHCKKSAEEMCAWINAGDTVESCLDVKLRYIMEFYKGVYYYEKVVF